MPGLLGDSFDDPRTSGVLALAAGLGHGDFTGGLLGYSQAMQSAKQQALAQQLAQLDLQKTQMGVDEMRRKITDDDAARKVLQGIYGGNGLPQSPMPGGSPAIGLPGAVPARPAPGAIPGMSGMVSPSMPAIGGGPPSGGVTPKAEVWQQYKSVGDALAGQGLIEKAQQYYGMAEKMRPKYGTEPRVVTGPDGKLVNIIVGEDGSTQVLPFGVKPSIKMQDLGGRVVAVDENALTGGQAFNKTQTPDSAASVAATLRGQNLTDARARDQIQLGKVPAGYRQAADGALEFIPGGPADPNAAKKAAPTEFQGKSAAFGARAQEADKILSGLQGQYSPAAVNTKTGLESVPLIGGAAGGAANMFLTANGQRAEQAQRDFVNAVLRQESGAAISAGEFDNAKKQYFPQPGDSAEVIQQKARNRAISIQGFRENSRPGAVDAVAAAGPAPTFDKMPPANPANKGKTLRDTESGKRYQSNGLSWVEVK